MPTPPLTHVRRQGVLDERVEGSQNLVVSDQQVRLCAERVEHAGKLDRDVSGSDNGDSLRLLLDVEEAVRVDSVRGTRDLVIGGDGRSSTDSDSNLLRLDRVALAVEGLDGKGVRVDERSVTLVVVDLVVDKVLLAAGQGLFSSARERIVSGVRSL